MSRAIVLASTDSVFAPEMRGSSFSIGPMVFFEAAVPQDTDC